ncbi:hypothetical protein D7Z54_20245 [Salibacterium salarium]|uniref:Mannitol repressor n=1 Tax=Salibacterium salarium TaxID=284579 RepID=A0A428MZI4_9BACI|nr:hypothetical protein [Salibacterium salarium]RSL31570.1 hypothetical protein D7Z54_20245 [Salibacterium salarium]
MAGTRAETAYSLSKFLEHIFSNESPFEQIIKGHLVIENQLNQLLSLDLKYPNEIPNLYFKAKVELLVALGVLKKEYKAPYLKLNAIRNRYAHSLDYELSIRDIDDFESTLSSEQKNAYSFIHGEITEEDISKRLEYVINFLWFALALQTSPPHYEEHDYYWRDINIEQELKKAWENYQKAIENGEDIRP